jgi:hypothetical protein
MAAGGAALLAGCGKDDAAQPPPRPLDALTRELAAEQAASGALVDLIRSAALGTVPKGARREPVRRIFHRTRGRARRLAAAVTAEGGRPYDAAAHAAARAAGAAAWDAATAGDRVAAPKAFFGDPRAGDFAIAALRAAVAAHVAALPDLTPDLRELALRLTPEAAADLAVLGSVLGVPAAEAFPGSA